MTQLSAPRNNFSAWLPRLLLATMLAFGSEVLVWTNPPGRTLVEWLLLIPGYLALSAVMLDLLARYRVNDIFGALVVTGVYALAASLILNPQSTLTDMPRTLMTRIMGAHGLLSAEMLGLFLALTGGQRTRRGLLLAGCGVVGIAWGIWTRWYPTLNDPAYAPTSLPLILTCGGVMLALIFGILALNVREAATVTVDDMRLSRTAWGVVFLVLLALFVVRYLVQGAVNVGDVLLIGGLLLLCWGILYFRGRTKGRTLLDSRLPVRPPPPGLLLASLAVFIAAAVIAFNLPLIEVGGLNSFSFIGLGFLAYGLAWLPTVSLVLGIQAYLRQIDIRDP
jgi:hypothetical protein